MPHFILTTGSVTLFGFILAFYVYFAPAILALMRAHRRFWVIAGLNLFAGPLQIALCEYFGFFLRPAMSTAEFTSLTLLMLLGPGWLLLIAWALADKGALDARLLAWRQTKTYDMAAALPLIAWFLDSATTIQPTLMFLGRLIAAGQGSLLMHLQFASLLLSALLCLFFVWLPLTRDVPLLRMQGLLPRITSLGGTFLAAGMPRLTMPEMTLWQQGAVYVLIGAGALAAMAALGWLGKAFAIMPEARNLVTTGPYAHVRHPLYAAQIVIVLGLILQYQQPWSLLLGGAVIAFQVIRSLYEERVLTQAFPEYDAYRARTKRFIPGVI